ncbi:hypothetical protein [Pararhizobium sp.]|uniref:hypothetical protein n=1 Tax=Pararhizobium sp. TaxID=1977563 RepID=UPI00271C5125|nr:hypothetical protein [Pararhizobium sp.]MDO9415686.1 hypothetical protein [Pararhizobium sp.]
MPQVIFLLLIGAIAWFGYRKFITDAEKLTRNRKRRDQEQKTGAIGTLVKDPETGEYRLKKPEE